MLFLLCNLACAAIYGLLAGMVLLQSRRNAASWLLLAASLATAAWAVAGLFWQSLPVGIVSLLDLTRALAWYAVVLHLHHLAVSDRKQVRWFVSVGLGLLVGGVAVLLAGQADGPVSLFTGHILLRFLLAVSQIVLLENLYRGTTPELRWHVGLACVALGSLAGYDLMLDGNAVLSHAVSQALVTGRLVVASLVAPLLAVSAVRNRNWGMTLHASRAAVFHTATLMGSGVFLLSLAAVAEFLKQVPWLGQSDWTELLQVALIFSGFVALGVLLVSASARNRLARLVSEHFFTYRYDYRREWLRCIETLSGDDGGDPDGLPRRAIRAIADVVDSPAGLLLTGQPDQAGLSWAGSWNLPAVGPLPSGHPLLAMLAGGRCIELDAETWACPPLDGLKLWLAMPLNTRRGGLAGCVLLAPPRGPFRLDEEVFSLLGVIAGEVTTHLAEQRATRTLVETRDLRVYGERFAFVAHDIKNVAGQLRLLAANASKHIADPAFQRDMLATVEASVRKIANLIRRLDTVDRETAASPLGIPLLRHVEAALATRPQAKLLPLPAEVEGWPVDMADADLAAVLTHLLDNAATAAGADGRVQLSIFGQPGHVFVDIVDDGPGMTPEFVRDELFRPFSTRTVGGSGIGAYQARELLRGAGGDLLVLSRPGQGTTMRLQLPRSGSAALAGRQGAAQLA